MRGLCDVRRQRHPTALTSVISTVSRGRRRQSVSQTVAALVTLAAYQPGAVWKRRALDLMPTCQGIWRTSTERLYRQATRHVVFIARVSTLRLGRPVLVTPPPPPCPIYLRGKARARPMVSPWLVALPAVHSSCASAYTTAAEMLARWCARNELGDVRAVPYWV